jgi:hypothetical protein
LLFDLEPRTSTPSSSPKLQHPLSAHTSAAVQTETCISQSTSTGTQASASSSSVYIQAGESLHAYENLKKQVDRLTNAKNDLTKENKEHKCELQKLREVHTQLAQAFNEMCDRNNVLQTQNDSLHSQIDQPFTQPKQTSPVKTSSTSTTSRKLSNPFGVLNIEDTDQFPALPSTTPTAPNRRPSKPCKYAPRHTSPQKPKHTPENRNAPSTLSRTPPKQTTQHQQPATTCKTKEIPIQSSVPASFNILIFSNSICKRIDAKRFYPGKTTKVYAKSGASIDDVNKLVADCKDTSPETVILQAWTNNTTRCSAKECHREATLLINATLKKFPSAHIIVSGVLPRLCPLEGSNQPNLVSMDLNDIFRLNCNNTARTSFVDHSCSFITTYGEIVYELYWDDVHLKNNGLAKLVMNLRNAINAVYPHRNTYLPKT